jgi:predicted P-loop ATPase
MLECTQQGNVKQSAGNYRTILLHDPNLKGAFRLNMFTDKIDITKDLGWYRESENLTDVDLKFLVLYFEKHYGLANEKRIDDAIKVVANENRYHPVRDYLNALQWDGVERIRYCLHHFLGAEVSNYTYEVMKLFMMGIISRVFRPGIKFEVMLCLVGGQGAGKSTLLRFLAMNDDWFTDDLKKMDDDNVYRKLQGHLLVEVSEMVAVLNAKNVEDTKSFLSKQKDTYKTPYDKHPKDHKRQCVFAGSSNSLDFLPMDRSGNRRFLPIQCNANEAEVHILEDEKASREYIAQMWAEAMEIYRSGKYQMRLPKDVQDELYEYQKRFMQEDTKKELILDYLEHYEGNMVCSRQLYAEALANDGSPAHWEIREINDIMNNCSGWIAFSNPRYFPEPYRRQRGWEKPDNKMNDFQPLTEEQMEQLSLPEEWMK